MPVDRLIPLKSVLALCAISRATLWRVARSNIAGFPPATKKAGRLFWRESEIEALKLAIAEFDGRTVFDTQRQAERDRVRTTYHRATAAKLNAGGRRKIKRTDKRAQGELFHS